MTILSFVSNEIVMNLHMKLGNTTLNLSLVPSLEVERIKAAVVTVPLEQATSIAALHSELGIAEQYWA